MRKVVAALLGLVFGLSLQTAGIATATSDESWDSAVESALLQLNCDMGDETVVERDDGMVNVVGCLTLGTENSQERGYRPTERQTYRCGSSYVENFHYGLLFYRGTVYASGARASGQNCGGSGRVGVASIRYTRNGKQLGAAHAGVGQKRTIQVKDNLSLRGPKTQYSYNFLLRK